MENLILVLISVSFLAYLFSCLAKHKILSVLGQTLLSLALLASIYLIARHFYQTQRLPLTNTSETFFLLITLIVMVYLVLEYKIHLPKAGGLIVSLISLSGLYAAFYIFKKPLMPLLPALQSRWLVFHVSSCIIAYGFFSIAFIIALVYIFKKVEGQRLLEIMHRCVCVGFLFLTSGIILGSIWGKLAWGHWWNWDPKEVWALVTWLIYASYIHGCLFENRTVKKLIAVSILGFLACLFTYLGVNYLLRGLHSYA